ncbi:MAG TPA: peptidylprolyl isomerase [Chloroflexota bacterium]|nr:peptidylprolyl isomerase [Chloroflexota bacterium]
MSQPEPPSGTRRTRRAPEPRRNPLQKPKGILYSGLSAVLLVLLVITLVQAACSPATTPAAATPSAPAASVRPSAQATASAPASAPASAAASASISPKPTFSSPPPMSIDTSHHYTAKIETEKGTIVLDLDPQLAPQTVNNFVFLAKQSFYDGLKWHRVVPDFVIQGGDPQGTGGGGPGYKFPDEPVKGEYKDGCVATANAGPNTNGSQFFICIADDTTKLQKLYNLFGYVTSGLDVAKRITTTDHMLKVTVS